MSAGDKVYPFSKLRDLDYYGDWPTKPSGMGMAYYEIYNGEDEDIHYVFDKERDTDTRLALIDGENDIVTKDGFAIFSVSKTDLTVTVGNKTFTNLKATTDEFNIEGKKYYAFLLPDEALDVQPAQGEFYVQVTAKHDTGDTFTMYFNPDVALSHVNPSDGAIQINKPTTTPKTIYVRSARQFRALSTLQNCWTQDYRYIQQLNIDATQYDGWKDADRLVASIGNAQKKFNASYTAAYTNELGVAKQHSITGFRFDEDASGFFGVIGENGTVEELIVNGDKLTVNTTDADAAVLAGRNEGIISNVDLKLTGDTSVTARTNAGLLAGYSSGIVRSCEVTAATVTLKAENCGGLIGSAVGTEEEKATLSKSTLALSGELKLSATENAGGLIGNAEHLSLTAGEPLVSLKEVAATGENAGGLIGSAKDTDIKITDAENAVTVTAVSITNSNGTAAGALGTGTNVTANGVDVTVGSVSGKVAAGFLGTGTNVDASFCDVVVKPNSRISGTEMAAGMAGTIGPQSVFNLCTVTLTDVTVSATAGDAAADAARNAAGYAVEIAAEAEIRNSSVTLGGSAKIEASNNAAGYACAVAGYVGNASGSAVSSSVVGHGTITGKNAAGFACDITGQVASSFVTPALNSGNYRGNSNDNLKVIASENAAGFALSVGQKATVTNCYALNKIVAKSEGAKLAGFVRTNKGEITGCMANVTLNGGYAFVEKNEGVVSRSYGWYDHADDAAVPVADVDGKFFSCYFADLNPADKEGPVAVLYTFEGDKKEGLTAGDLQASINLLAGNGLTWQKPDGYEAYPYTVPEKTPDYLYPMLRDHYGDWLTPPMYAYGVAYYEVYSTVSTAAETTEGAGTTDGTTSAPTTASLIKLHMVDLSDPTLTEEGAPVTTWLVDDNGTVTVQNSTVFNNDDVISETGYAVFARANSKILSDISEETKLFSYKLTTNGKEVTYDFFRLKAEDKNGVVSIPETAFSKTTATVQTWFADAINVTDNTYQVRTPEQLANIKGLPAAHFSQTHDITVKDFTTAANLNGSYNGTGLQLTVSNQQSSWITTVGGSVTNLNLQIPNGVNAPVFGTVSPGANVTLTGLSIGPVGAEGALANVVSGTMTVVPAISTPAVNGMLFGDKNGTVSTGTINTGAITVNGEVATLFGNVANVTVDGAIQTGKVNTQLFGDVSGTVSTGAINVTGTAAKVFGNVTGGSVTVNGGITTAGAAQIFGTVGAEVAVTGPITTGDLTGNAIGEVKATMTLSGGITVGDVPAESYVIAGFENGTNEVNTGNVTVTKNIAGNVFGDVNGTVKIGAVKTQAAANIFGDVTGGSLTVTSVNTEGNAVSGNVFGNVSATVIVGTVAEDKTVTGGPITTGDVSGNVFGTVGADVTVGSITVASVAKDKAIVAAVDAGDVKLGTVTIPAQTSTDEEGNQTTTWAEVPTLIGPVGGGKVYETTLALGNANTGKSLIASVGAGAIVDTVTVNTSGKLNAPVVGGDLGGTLKSMTVNIGSAEVNGAVLVGKVVQNTDGTLGIVEGCTVKASGTVTAKGDTFGVLTAVNGGELKNNTVTNAEGASLALTVNGENGKTLVVGGLVGQNTGTVSGGTVDVAITYAQSNTTDDQGNVTATDKGATIGGLVGENSGTIGVADTVTQVKGAVNLTKKNDGQSRAYIIGGAVGNAQSGVTNTTANVQVDAEWAGAPNKEGSATFGSSGITNNGPVGMFVGFAGNATFTDCSSTDDTNETYQFVGEVKLGDQSITSGLWGSTVKSGATLEAYSDRDKLSDTKYQASATLSDNTVLNAELSSDISTCKTVLTEFDACTFILNKEARVVTYGADQFFYAMDDEPQSRYAIGTPVLLQVTSVADKSYDMNWTLRDRNVFDFGKNDAGLYYKISDNTFGRAQFKIERKQTSTIPVRYVFTATLRYNTDLTGKYIEKTYNTKELKLTDQDDTLVIGDGRLCNISVPAVPNGKYLIVSETNAVNSSAVTQNISGVTTFEVRDPLGNYVYSYNGSEVARTTKTGTETHAKTFGTANGQTFYEDNKVLFSFNGLGSGKYQLYPLTETPDAYRIMFFTYQNDAKYQRQFVTSKTLN